MRRLENDLKTFLQDVLKKSWKRLSKTSWRSMTKRIYWSCSRRLLKTWVRWIYLSWWRRLEDVLKTYEQDEYIGLDQDVFRRRMSKMNIFVLKTSSEEEDERRLQDFFKTPSSRWMFVGLLSTRRKTSLLFINSIHLALSSL